jgi:hypothetical protein
VHSERDKHVSLMFEQVGGWAPSLVKNRWVDGDLQWSETMEMTIIGRHNEVVIGDEERTTINTNRCTVNG